jgi:CheY-like chemotaxis protein
MFMLKPILLVEDNPHDLELSLLALEKSKLANEVAVARDGEEALDYLHRRGIFNERPPGNPAFIILDLKMPKIDGLEVLRSIRSNVDLQHIPVIMLTASKQEQDVLRSYEDGVNAFVVKPIDFQDLVKAVADLSLFWAMVNEPPPGSVKYLLIKSRDEI